MNASLASAFFFLAIALVASAEVPVPPLKTRVTDLAGVLSVAQRDAIERTLADFESRKGSQIAVLIVPTTKPEEIAQYGIRVAEAWKLGRKGVDDGVLLLVAKNDRKVRIEVGRGLEGAIPDAVAKRIVAEIVTPRFKQGDFEGGIREGVDRIVKVIEGEPLPSPRRVSAPTGRGAGPDWLFWAIFLIPVLPCRRKHRPGASRPICGRRRCGRFGRGHCRADRGIVSPCPSRRLRCVPARPCERGANGPPRRRLVVWKRLERGSSCGGGSDFGEAAETSAAGRIGGMVAPARGTYETKPRH